MALKIIMYYPKTKKTRAAWETRVAKFHANYVAQYIEKLNCPSEQKRQLVDAVVKTVMENATERANEEGASP